MTASGPRSALITGGSRGIGLQIAKTLAAQGMRLTITARNRDDLDTVAVGLRELGAAEVTTVAADMADPEGLPAILAAHRTANPDLSALILCAGVGTAGRIADYPQHRLDKTMAVNFRAPFLVVQAALPLLRAAATRHPETGAKVVVLASIAGVYPEAGLGAYGASKAAAISLAEAVNAEESGHGVSATAIAPAYVDTDMSAWVQDAVPAETMIPSEDVAIITETLLRLSHRSTIGRIVMSRAGSDAHRA